jgi:excisionase family DNA binding protein
MRRRRISKASQSPALKSGSPTTGAGTQKPINSRPCTVSEDAEPSNTSTRPTRRVIEWGPMASGHVAHRHHRGNQLNFFTIADVAERLHVSARTVRRWIEAGDLVVHRVGGIVRIAEADFRAFLALHREG